MFRGCFKYFLGQIVKYIVSGERLGEHVKAINLVVKGACGIGPHERI